MRGSPARSTHSCLKIVHCLSFSNVRTLGAPAGAPAGAPPGASVGAPPGDFWDTHTPLPSPYAPAPPPPQPQRSPAPMTPRPSSAQSGVLYCAEFDTQIDAEKSSTPKSTPKSSAEIDTENLFNKNRTNYQQKARNEPRTKMYAEMFA